MHFLVIFCGGMILYMTSPIAFYIISIYLFTNNNTYSHYIFIPIEYSVNQEKYIYAILLHSIVFGSVVFMIIIAVCTLLTTFMKHVSGLLKIAR